MRQAWVTRLDTAFLSLYHHYAGWAMWCELHARNACHISSQLQMNIHEPGSVAFFSWLSCFSLPGNQAGRFLSERAGSETSAAAEDKSGALCFRQAHACNTHRGPQMTRPAGQTQPPPLTLSLPEAQDLGPGTWTGKFTHKA